MNSIYLYRCAGSKRYKRLYNRRISGSPALRLLTGITISRTRTNTSVVTPSSVVSKHVSIVQGTLSAGQFSRVSIVSCTMGCTSKCCNPFHSTTSSTPQFNSHHKCRVSPTGDHRTVGRISLSVRRNTSVVVIGPTLTCLSVIRRVHRQVGHPITICGIDNRCTVIGTTTTGK